MSLTQSPPYQGEAAHGIGARGREGAGFFRPAVDVAVFCFGWGMAGV